MDATPFIKRIKTHEGYYIYDVYKNEILPVEPVTYHLIQDFHNLSRDQWLSKHKKKYPLGELRENWDYIFQMTKEGYFNTDRPMDTGAADLPDHYYENFNGKEFNELTLIPCEQCNLRCTYCSYSGSYPHNRTHKSGHMSIDTAAKALKMVKLPKKSENPTRRRFTLNLFGGEPFLNIGVIKFCQQEIAREAHDQMDSLSLVIETNGTLLTPRIVDYLVASGIFLRVSLDGPKQLHDRYRRYKNGRGTYDRLVKNLSYIKTKYPEYYGSVSFNMVLDPPFYDAVNAEFDQLIELIGDNRVLYSSINPNDTSFISPRELEAKTRYIDGLRERFVASMVNGSDDNEYFLKSYFSNALTQSLRFMLRDKDPTVPPVKKSVCPMGQAKALVDADDGLTPCIEYWNKGIKMGNLETGLQLDHVDRYLTEYRQKVLPHCRDCWLIRFCDLCPPLFLEKDSITEQKRENLCRQRKEKYLKDLRMTISIIEQKPEALKYIEDYNVLKDILPSSS